MAPESSHDLDENGDPELAARLQRHDLLRALGVRRGARHLDRATPPTPASPATAVAPETTRAPDSQLPGQEVQTPFGRTWLCATSHDLDEHPELAAPLHFEPDAWSALARSESLRRLDPARAAFIDTETTGLAQGTGTYTFMIGIGTYEAGGDSLPTPSTASRFVVRQFFMRNPAEERAQLHLVEDILGRCNGIVSFNGLGFDMPLIETRLVLARIPHPLPGAPHLDLLPPARRLWSARLSSCRLGNLEREVLGLQRSEEDVPGWLIPTIYREYYQSGKGSDLLSRVFYHNRLDITSMPALAGHMGALFQPDGIGERLTALDPIDCASLARCYERLGWIAPSEMAYRVALAGATVDAQRSQLMRALGQLMKRQGRHDEAARIWEDWIGSVPGNDPTPFIELAKYHEWQSGQLAVARGWAAWALSLVDSWPAEVDRVEWRRLLEQRLARIERKLGPPAEQSGGG